MKVDFSANKSIQDMEEDVGKYWKEKKIFEKSVESRPEENSYVFYDGPPFISGLPHYGHLLGSIAKDVIPRYWTMKGKRVERVWGWDAHGLTVENQVQKELGIKNRRDIESYGLEKFIKACYKYTSKVSAEWEWYVDRIGRWVDFKNAYKTNDQNYMETVIWVFKQMYDKELVYEGVRTSLFCTTCGTPVSNFEIAMDNSYREEEDPSAVVKFRVISKGEFKDAFILAWTTTVWTLPSNRALVVDERETYVVAESGSEKYIVAEKRLEEIFKGEDYKVLEEFKGKKLLGLDYEPLYTFFKPVKGEFKVYSFEGMVNMEEGTGVVHSAPGFGEIDTEMGRHYDLTLMLKLDDEGKFIEGDNGKNPYEKMTYLEANPLIKKDLEKRGALFGCEAVLHRVPYHDRCNTTLIHKAQNSWFINVSKLKRRLAKTNQPINWIPEYLKRGRFEIGIKQAPDWCISRNRFWATPMPIWESEDGDRIVISSIKDLENQSGGKVNDLHRPYIDEVVIRKGGKEYRRRSEVLDSWMEAGSMPYAQLHYPFENQEKFERNFPGDYIVEYIGQVRAWFYVMHVLSTALFGKNSFKNVISTGIVAGSDGRKMSKTYKNYPDPREVLQNIGGDALRLYLMNSPLMVGENISVNEEEIRIKLRNVLNPLWNSVKFFIMYKNLHNWNPEDASDSKHVLDEWILIRLQETIKIFSENIEGYNIPLAVQGIEDFIDDLSRWYVRRSRKRVSSGDNEALSTLYKVLVDLSKTAAPIIPFMAESMYQVLVLSHDENASESVHLCEYPDVDNKILKSGRKNIEVMVQDRVIVSEALAIRAANKIPIRDVISEFVTEKEVHNREIVEDEINVNEIKDKVDIGKFRGNPNFIFHVSEPAGFNTEVTEEIKAQRAARKLIRKIQVLRKKEGLNVMDLIDVWYKDTDENNSAVEKFGDDIKETVGTASLTPSDEYKIVKKS